MDIEDIAYQTLRSIALCHNYNKWIYEIIKPYLGKKILEVGCGVGNLTGYLQEGRKLVAIDVSSRFVAYMKLDYPNVETYNCDIVTSQVISLKKYDFDSVVCVNVLEHIEDDSRALFNMYELTKEGGYLMLMVPAHSFLYGSLDLGLAHYRRYSKKDLINKVRQAKFKIEKVSYFNTIGILGWFLNSRIQRKKTISVLQLMLFDKITPYLRKIEKCFDPPFGMSLFIVGRQD